MAALLFTSVAASDLTPHALRLAVVRPYGVKAMMSIVIWLVVQAELWGIRRTAAPASDETEVRALHGEQRPPEFP